MKKIEKHIISGIIESSLHKAGKLIEQGKLVTGDQFEQMLQEKSNYDHLYFWVVRFTLESGRGAFGNPYVETIVTSTEGTHFRGYFRVAEPPGTFSNQTLFAQNFGVEEIKDED